MSDQEDSEAASSTTTDSQPLLSPSPASLRSDWSTASTSTFSRSAGSVPDRAGDEEDGGDLTIGDVAVDEVLPFFQQNDDDDGSGGGDDRLHTPFRKVLASKALAEDSLTVRSSAAWWFMGLFNNISFVIMAASAKSILPSSVGAVYLASSFPSLLLRLSAPYWFDRVSVSNRMHAASLMFVAGFTSASLFSHPALRLLGVALVSAQCGLGEASMLALSTRHGNEALTLWASGTGASGIAGYLYVVCVTRWMGVSDGTALLGGAAFGGLYYSTFRTLKVPPADRAPEGTRGKGSEEKLTAKEKLRLTLSLWPWGVPLVVVYFAEYAMQAGTWSSVGFPVTDSAARDEFYQNSNWCYQLGVVVSRSSGTVWRPKLKALWIMPAVQLALLAFSTLNADNHWWYNQSLLLLSVVVGLFGGAVYVNGFRLITEGAEGGKKELAVAAASACGDAGANLGDAAGIFLQRWLDGRNGIRAR